MKSSCVRTHTVQDPFGTNFYLGTNDNCSHTVQLGMLSPELSRLYKALRALRVLGGDEYRMHDDAGSCAYGLRVERVVVLPGGPAGVQEVVLSEQAEANALDQHGSLAGGPLQSGVAGSGGSGGGKGSPGGKMVGVSRQGGEVEAGGDSGPAGQGRAAAAGAAEGSVQGPKQEEEGGCRGKRGRAASTRSKDGQQQGQQAQKGPKRVEAAAADAAANGGSGGRGSNVLGAGVAARAAAAGAAAAAASKAGAPKGGSRKPPARVAGGPRRQVPSSPPPTGKEMQ